MDDSAARHRRWSWAILALVAIVRILVALFGIGTNDSLLFQQFGREMIQWPLGDIWLRDSWMNNPPLPGLWAAVAYLLAGEKLYLFSLVWKVPSIVAEVLSALLILRIVAERTGDRRAARIAGLFYALNPAAIFVSGYHGNIDAVLALFALVAWREASRGRFGWAGLAAAVAVNVKVSAGPAVLLLLGCARSRDQFLKASGALALGAIPFAVATAIVGRPFLEQVLLYRPPAGVWLFDLPYELRDWPVFGPAAIALRLAHAATLMQSTLLAIVLLVTWWQRSGRPQTQLLVVGALFWTWLLLWIGGSLQYVIWPLPLLAATRPRIGLLYGIAAGVWLAWAYHDAVVATWPWQSLFFVTTPTRSRFAIALPIGALFVAVFALARSLALFGNQSADHENPFVSS